jgi:hypothetical protein
MLRKVLRPKKENKCNTVNLPFAGVMFLENLANGKIEMREVKT